MQIKEITQHSYEVIETDESEYPTWRRNSDSSWENLMGESWEGMEPPEELVKAYHNYKTIQSAV